MLISWSHQSETAEKIADFWAFWLNISNGSTDFHQTYVTFRQVYIENLKMDDRPFTVAMVTNSWGSAGLKIMIQGKKSGIFLKFRTDTAFLSSDLKSEA